ncbi:MAG: FKBP-type peptidyl-prolyl cis-trans isomerase [bacterium]
MPSAKMGDKVKVHYVGTLTDGTEFDSSIGGEPLEFTIGEGDLLEKFEQTVVGLQPGESGNVNISAEEAYGERREELVIKIEKSKLLPDLKPEVGMELRMQTPEGDTRSLNVIEVTDEDITVDANHELAGEDLNFNIQLIEIT